MLSFLLNPRIVSLHVFYELCKYDVRRAFMRIFMFMFMCMFKLVCVSSCSCCVRIHVGPCEFLFVWCAHALFPMFFLCNVCEYVIVCVCARMCAMYSFSVFVVTTHIDSAASATAAETGVTGRTAGRMHNLSSPSGFPAGRRSLPGVRLSLGGSTSRRRPNAGRFDAPPTSTTGPTQRRPWRARPTPSAPCSVPATPGSIA